MYTLSQAVFAVYVFFVHLHLQRFM